MKLILSTLLILSSSLAFADSEYYSCQKGRHVLTIETATPGEYSDTVNYTLSNHWSKVVRPLSSTATEPTEEVSTVKFAFKLSGQEQQEILDYCAPVATFHRVTDPENYMVVVESPKTKTCLICLKYE